MKMLQTALHEIETAEELKKLQEENENLMVVCGRMGPMCIPVYDAQEELQDDYDNVKFCVMAFDNPEANIVRQDPACAGFMGLPFTMYYKNGETVHATTSIQSLQQVKEIIDSKF